MGKPKLHIKHNLSSASLKASRIYDSIVTYMISNPYQTGSPLELIHYYTILKSEFRR